MRITERGVGTYFDWISAAGGLNKGLRLLFRVAVSLFNYNVYSVYMVSHLFKIGYQAKTRKFKRKMSRLGSKVDITMDKETNFGLNPSKISSIKMLFFDLIPKSWRKSLEDSGYKLLRRGENYRLFEKGIMEYQEEIDIVTMIRDLRWLKMAVKELIEDAPDRPDRVGRRTLHNKRESLLLDD